MGFFLFYVISMSFCVCVFENGLGEQSCSYCTIASAQCYTSLAYTCTHIALGVSLMHMYPASMTHVSQNSVN